MNYKPLVSCTVITYNSSKTVLETLESIKNQTYQNIELIVSDDCSTDSTISLCHDWIERNRERFVRVELITVDKNTGVSGNANRATKACRGEWQKGIAADDKMLADCIENYIDFINNNPEAKIISSFIRVYNDTFDESNCVGRNVVNYRAFFDLSLEEQLKKMACWNRIAAPSIFVNREMKLSLGGYDSSYSFEDYPFFIKVLENGHRFYFMDRETVCYRIHQSISHSKGQLFNYAFMKESRRFHKEKCYKYLNVWQKAGQTLFWGMQALIERVGLNKNSLLMDWFYRLCKKCINSVFCLK